MVVGVIKIKFKVSYGLTFEKYIRKLDQMIGAAISLSAQPEFFQNVKYASPLAGAVRPA